MDVKTVFLHSELEKEIYINQPEGYIQEGQKNKVYLLTSPSMDLSSLPDSGTSNLTLYDYGQIQLM